MGITDEIQDVAIVGSGFGGAFVAHACSQRGLRTLLIERGPPPARDDDDWDAVKILVEGRYRGQAPALVDQYGAGPREDYFDEVLGGMSILYGGAAIRLREQDFARWPVSYADMEPWYAEAERVLEVHGTAESDPTEPARSGPYPYTLPELTPPARRIFDAASRLGYRPFMLPMALHYEGGRGREKCQLCLTCDGFPCKIGAKNDAVTTALDKAPREHLQVVTGVTAKRFVRDEATGRITSLECVDAATGELLTIRARTFVSACGTLQSPALLLRSGLDRLDASGTLGRNLMRHCNAIVGCLFPFRINPGDRNHKQVGITHFYEAVRDRDGTSTGIIQDMCMPPAAAVRHLAPAGLGLAAAAFVKCIQSLICIAEDAPQADNRVTLDPERTDANGLPLLNVHHTYTQADLARRNLLVRHAKKVLHKAGGWFTVVRVIDSFSHAVGSVRFGSDPSQATLDPWCRTFGTPNLFVVDGSFFPTSGGVNPSLTIAAMALRVGNHIADSADATGVQPG